MTDKKKNTAQSEAKRKGRPSLYKKEYADAAAHLCRDGATDSELADYFNIALSTLYDWRNRYTEFSEAVIAGKDSADDRVERAYYNRAVGYSYTREKVFQHQGEVIRTHVLEHVIPDPGAAVNWLKNRRPDKWRDKQTVEHEGHVMLTPVINFNAKSD